MEWELLAADRSSSPSSSGCRRLSAAATHRRRHTAACHPAAVESAGSPGSRRRVAGAAIAVLAATHWTLTKLRPSPPPRTAAVIQLSACLLLLQLLPGSVHAQEIVFSRHRNSQPSTTAKDRVYYSSLFSTMILNCLLLESGELCIGFL